MHMPMAAPNNREVVPNSLLGMLIFVSAEIMLFLGFISAFTISRAGAPLGTWSLPGTVLPTTETMINTSALVASGVCLFATQRQLRQRTGNPVRTLLVAWLLGATFVLLQGREWWRLLRQGLTLTSSPLGAFFYLIVGAHAVHAVAALVALGVAWWSLSRGRLSSSYFLGAATFWYFVVGVWPLIYWRVYF